MRVLKDPEVRRSEILDTAEQLFVTKGYAKTTVMDILNANGIAKGTFYYYFKSKEEVLDAVIGRVVENDVAAARRIGADPNLSPGEKIVRILLAQRPGEGANKDRILAQFHQPGNAEMRQKSLVQGIRGLSPILAEIVEEGVRQDVFHTSYPMETMELLMAAGQVLLDQGVFRWLQEERQARAMAFVQMAEASLGAQPGTFGPMLALFTESSS